MRASSRKAWTPRSGNLCLGGSNGKPSLDDPASVEVGQGAHPMDPERAHCSSDVASLILFYPFVQRS